MNKDGHFGTREAVCLMTLSIFTKVLYTSPTVMVQLSGNAAWYMTIISTITAICFFLLLCLLMKRFPESNIVEIFDKVLGKFLGKLVSLIFVAYFIYYTGSILREFLEMIKAYNLPYTPTSLIMITFLGVCLLGVYLGLEAIARLSYLAFFSIFLGLLVLYLLGISNYEIGYLSPYLGYGITNTLYYGLLRSSAYDEIFWLAVIINSLQGYKNFKKIGILSLVFSGAVISISLFCYILTFGYNMGQESLSGIFELSRLIYYNRFFQRVESIFLFTWVISSLISVSFSLYISISMYCKAFKINKHGPLLVPLALLTYLVAFLPQNLSEVIQRNMVIIREYSFILVFGAPILVLLISLIRGKKGEEPDAKKV